MQQDLLDAGFDQRDLRQAIRDMNQRIRYAAGKYGTPARIGTAATVTIRFARAPPWSSVTVYSLLRG